MKAPAIWNSYISNVKPGDRSDDGNVTEAICLSAARCDYTCRDETGEGEERSGDEALHWQINFRYEL